MSVKIVQGNLMEATEDIIGHQVNCMGVMGAGLAKLIKRDYPEVFKQYKQSCSNKGELLGRCQIVSTKNEKCIANLFGQYGYGVQKRHTDYIALRGALNELMSLAMKSGQSIALPYNIGCGLAGGDWDIVGQIIEEVFIDYDVTLYKFE
ncbi:Appr-1-p processing protein [Paenibacillus chitinolyticus]|uniref:macro domain-containing protein n=1 Tax=Paenibacillus chitinolyticus TaxID=79263 RepID=UPI0026E4D405|nr:macro domain-containing protein [Paenibacillus chitinolyticus]GKS11223.1 Appr-1-p processing protein [Paenibacillus chitinolyticus]